MADPIQLFAISPQLDRNGLGAKFAREGRLQIRDVLTPDSAREIHKILSKQTPWGVSWQAAAEGPHHIRPAAMAQKSQREILGMTAKLKSAMQRDEYAFIYSAYPMLDAVLEQWDPGGPHEILLEHLNDDPFLNLIREVTAIPELLKADGQATLYAPGHFLTQHNDSHMAEGRRVAYVLNLTAGEWRPDWGGYLLFYDEDGDVTAGFRPRFNSLNLFRVPQLHSVTYVPPFSPIGRYAITGWLRDR